MFLENTYFHNRTRSENMQWLMTHLNSEHSSKTMFRGSDPRSNHMYGTQVRSTVWNIELHFRCALDQGAFRNMAVDGQTWIQKIQGREILIAPPPQVIKIPEFGK